jgi:hypothetical protein
VSQLVAFLRERHAAERTGVDGVEAMGREMINEQCHFIESFGAH